MLFEEKLSPPRQLRRVTPSVQCGSAAEATSPMPSWCSPLWGAPPCCC